ncbi:BRO-N domain-containing protein, partial [Pseudomonas helleri]|uniref:BRO-N domain-containing protein n=1 Tax=Pseudomonas helleri TaxID=1608996 RepID=UPI003FD3E883
MNKDNTAASNVIPFEFGAKKVRTVIIEDQVWFIASDVAGCLEYINPRDAISKHVDQEDRNTVAIRDGKPGNPNQAIINESGLYALIFGSDKPEAKRFKKWVTAEVLPAIRKHGHYNDSLVRMGTLIGQTIGTDGFHML